MTDLVAQIRSCSSLEDLTTLFLANSKWLEESGDRDRVQSVRQAFNTAMLRFQSELEPDDLEFIQENTPGRKKREPDYSLAPEIPEDNVPILIPTGWENLGWDRVPGTINEADLDVILMPACWAGKGWDRTPGVVISRTPCTSDCEFCRGRG